MDWVTKMVGYTVLGDFWRKMRSKAVGIFFVFSFLFGTLVNAGGDKCSDLTDGRSCLYDNSTKYVVFCEFDDGSTYEGYVNCDRKFDGHGQYKTKSDFQYVGSFRNGKYHGHGVLIYSDGSRYVGEFYLNDRHGNGEYVSADGRYSIGGLWKDDRLNGDAVENYKGSGDTWHGSYINGARVGDWRIHQKDGAIWGITYDANGAPSEPVVIKSVQQAVKESKERLAREEKERLAEERRREAEALANARRMEEHKRFRLEVDNCLIANFTKDSDWSVADAVFYCNVVSGKSESYIKCMRSKSLGKPKKVIEAAINICGH